MSGGEDGRDMLGDEYMLRKRVSALQCSAYHCLCLRPCKPSLSVISAALIALGRSCLLANTSRMESLNSSSLSMRCSSSRAAKGTERMFINEGLSNSQLNFLKTNWYASRSRSRRQIDSSNSLRYTFYVLLLRNLGYVE